MHIKSAPCIFLVAMVKHIEYDDKFWRFVKDINVGTNKNFGDIQKIDSGLWRVTAHQPEIEISYRIQLPPPPDRRGSWKPFLTTNGGLVGGTNSFLYVVGHLNIPCHVQLILPPDWSIATGLARTVNDHIYYASSVYTLTDEPFLIGKLSHWQFTVDGVPHQIAFYPKQAPHSFDTVALVQTIRKITVEAQKIFGGFPYKDYSFLLEDSSYGGLEHADAVNLGVNSNGMAESFRETLAETAHEYFHAWNLVSIKPFEYGDVTYKSTTPAKELWFSEGVTMFYADLMLRRAELPVYDSTRIKHLEQLLSSYFSEPGNVRISPEKVSEAANAEPSMLGDYSASPHVQGEVLGIMLDLIIRNASNNKKSLDDVMRYVMRRYGVKKGIANNDIEKAITSTCNCSVQNFFIRHIYGNKPPDVNKYLGLIGLRTQLVWKEVLNDDGTPQPDLRVYAWTNASGKLLLGITDPTSLWGKAGLHTNDEIYKINNEKVTTQKEFFSLLRQEKVGDTVLLEVKQLVGVRKVRVTLSGYRSAVVKVEKWERMTNKQAGLQQQWLTAK